LSKMNNPWRAVGLVSVIGADLAVCVVGGVFLGRYIDRLLSSSPWFLLVGLLVGLAVGIYSVYRLVRGYL